MQVTSIHTMPRQQSTGQHAHKRSVRHWRLFAVFFCISLEDVCMCLNNQHDIPLCLAGLAAYLNVRAACASQCSLTPRPVISAQFPAHVCTLTFLCHVHVAGQVIIIVVAVVAIWLRLVVVVVVRVLTCQQRRGCVHAAVSDT